MPRQIYDLDDFNEVTNTNNKTKDRASGIAPKKMYGRYLPLLEEVLSAK